MMRKLGVVVVVEVTMALAACTSSPQSAPSGTVTGRFVAIGGLTAVPRPLTGQVTAKTSTGRRFTVTVGKSGKFVLSLPAGLYGLTGRTPMVTVNGVEPTCGVWEPPVRVRAGKETRGVQVVCPLK